jgi:hypothetical protein
MEEFAAAVLLDGDYAVKASDFASMLPPAASPSADACPGALPAKPPVRRFVMIKTVVLVAMALLLGLGAIAGFAELFPRHAKKKAQARTEEVDERAGTTWEWHRAFGS